MRTNTLESDVANFFSALTNAWLSKQRDIKNEATTKFYKISSDNPFTNIALDIVWYKTDNPQLLLKTETYLKEEW